MINRPTVTVTNDSSKNGKDFWTDFDWPIMNKFKRKSDSLN